MTATPYSARRKGNNRPPGSAGAPELVTIPDAHAVSETEKALKCEFGDSGGHWVPKSQIAARSEVKSRGDRGLLIVPKWWAEKAGVLAFARAPSPLSKLRQFRHRLQELNDTLGAEDPARQIIKTLCDALREDLGIARSGGVADGGGSRGQTSAR